MARSKRVNATHHIELCACSHCEADFNAAKRMSDALNTYIHGLREHLFELRDKWMAFRLSDGTSDGVLYDSKRDAVRHQDDEFRCAYISFRNILGGASPQECVRVLNFTRDAYDAGFRLADPDDVHGGPDVAPTTAQMDAQQGAVIAVIKPELMRLMGLGVN